MYLLRTQLPMLNEDSDATVVRGILRTSQAIEDNSLKRLALSFQYETASKLIKLSISTTGSSKLVSNGDFPLPPAVF